MKTRALIGFALWSLAVVGLAVGCVVLSVQGGSTVCLAAVAGFALGAFLLWLLLRPPFRALRWPAWLGGAGLGVAAGRALPDSDAVVAFSCALLLGLIGPPLVVWAARIVAGLRAQRSQPV